MTVLVWACFIAFIILMVALDLGVFHRRAHIVRMTEALTWSGIWVALALAFNVLIFFLYEEGWVGWSAVASHAITGRQAALEFFTAYVLEKSLSIDNIFVIAMIFGYFRVPPAYQHRLLVWGVLGAMLLRGIMIALGAVLIARFDWIMYVFGALLIASAVKMLIMRHDNLEPDRNLAVLLVRRFHPVTIEFHGNRFFTRINGRRAATPLFLALLLIESSDVMFAIDSVPAVFAVTRDPFLVFTSNVFAILGLRSLYFALAGLMDRFRYLKTSLVFLLAYVGVKMILVHHFHIPNLVSLGIIGGILTVGVLASLLGGARDTAALVSPLLNELEELGTISYQHARRLVILVVGFSTLLIGALMIVLPGPAVLVIPLGLSILGLEFAWARRWLARIRKMADDNGRYVLNLFRRRSRDN